MEKASTPPNRLTRSAAKQVNTSSRKVERIEDANIVTRKPRKKAETKLKTNGENLINIERTITKHYEEVSDSNSIDSFASEDSNLSMKQSSKSSITNTPNMISRKSNRIRRSVTPCPELDESIAKPIIKRSTSESKLVSLSTPKNKRGSRAISESKDYVFTPSKADDITELSSLSKTSNEKIHRNSRLKIIDESAEVSEVDESSQDNQVINLKADKKDDNSENTFESEKTETDNVLIEDNIIQSSDILSDKNNCSNIFPSSKTSLISPSEHIDSAKYEDNDELKQDDSIVKTTDPYKDSIGLSQQLDINIENKIQIDLPQEDTSNTNDIDIISDDDYNNDDQVLNEEKSHFDVQIDSEKLDSTPKYIDKTDEIMATNNDFKHELINPTTAHSVRPDSSPSLNTDISGQDQIIKLVSSEHDCIFVVSAEANEEINYNEEKDDCSANSLSNDDKLTSKLSNDENNLMLSIPSHQETVEQDAVTKSGETESDTIELNITEVRPDTAELDSDCNLKHTIIQPDDDKNACDIVKLDESCNMPDQVIHEQYKMDNSGINLKTNEKLIENITLHSGVVECNKDNNIQIENHAQTVDSEINDSFNLQLDPSLQNVDKPNICDNNYESEHIVLDDETQPTNINIKPEIKNTDFSDPELNPKDGTSQQANMNQSYSRDVISSQDTYDGESSVKNEHSDSDSDIYKDMSDIGSHGGDEGNVHGFDANRSSDSESGESEEENASIIGDGSNNKDSSDRFVPLSDLTKTTEVSKNNEGDCKKSNETLFDNSTPMTYDKALAILNQNRVKKIDDEEFFDMFTQELNRVSAESGSDSDIAIVDEYIIEPEEPNESNQQINNMPKLNSKSPKSPHTPTVHSMQLSEHLAGVYNKQYPLQQNNSITPKTNVSQGSLYQHYSQNMMSGRSGPVIYDQYTQGPLTIPDPRMFNPPPHSDMHFNRSGPYISHAIEPPPSSNVHYPNSESLKVKNIHSLNSSQNSIQLIHHDRLTAMDTNVHNNGYGYVESYNTNATVSASTMTDGDNKQDQATSYNSPLMKGNQSMETVLEALGLNEEKLQLLKIALGLEGSKNLDKICKKYPLNKRKPRKRMKAKTLCTKNETSKRMPENSSSSAEHSNYDSSKNIECGLKKNIKNEQYKCSSDEGSDHESRQINVNGNNLSVTFKTIPQISSNHQLLDEFDTSSESSQNIKKRKRGEHINYTGSGKILIPSKRKKVFSLQNKLNKTYDDNIQELKQEAKGVKRNCPINNDSGDLFDVKALNPKKDKKRQQTLLKSNCGIFKIDSMTATSQSSDTSESDVNSYIDQVAGPSNYIQVMSQNKKGKSDLVSEKNKLSRLFSDRTIKKMKASGKIEKSQRKKRARTLKKLPMGVLEGLLAEEHLQKKSQERNSDSDERSSKLRKKRKRVSRIKLSSKVARQGYIPCVSPGPTQFSLSRLDDDSIVSAAEIAAKFRSDQLYGSSVKRVTILDFKG